MKKTSVALRRKIIETCQKMGEMGINQGTSGNVSVRVDGGILITPSAVSYDSMKPDDIMFVDHKGEREGKKGMVPSTEWRFHLDIVNHYHNVGAIVHTHSIYATILAICHKPIPAVHYMVAAAGGPTIRCGDYATFGTEKLSKIAIKALKDRTCCLLANHGVIATGPNLAKALWLAKEVEVLAQQHVFSSLLGDAKLLPDAEIQHVMEKFRDYGLKS